MYRLDLVIAGAVAGITAAAFAAYSLDGGFRSMIREGLVKVQDHSNTDGMF